jgi:hypothetical protein
MDEPQLDPLVEERLRASRPTPDPEFVAGLGATLFPPRRPRTRSLPAFRPVWAGAGVAAALACGAFVLGLAGTGPLAGGGHASQASDNCRFVAVKRLEQQPRVVNTPSGPQLKFSKHQVTRRVKRCS